MRFLKSAWWSAMCALKDAWGISMAAVFLTVERMGLWKLAWVSEGGRVMPHHTKRFENVVMWSGIVITSCLMAYGLIKIALWKGWILP